MANSTIMIDFIWFTNNYLDRVSEFITLINF